MITTSKLNTFLLFKLPAAYLTGVRARFLDDKKCIVDVKFRWINQNPFRSMYWAVQGMAAELATGALVMNKISSKSQNISMLVASNQAQFTKKAVGRITFSCDEGDLVDTAIEQAIESGEGQTIWLHAKGNNEEKIEVSSFKFQWTLKVRK